MKWTIILLVALPLWGGDLSLEEIINRANQAAYYAGDDGKATVTMTIHDGKGGTRERAFTMLRKNTGQGDQKFYLYFKEPADVRKMAYLVYKNIKSDDDRWLWMPALNLSKRIAPGDKRTSFVGSDFLYEDVSGRGLDEDEHQLVETTQQHYIIKNTPKDEKTVEFTHYTIWIDKSTFLPMKAEYHDSQGLYRRIEALKVETIDGIPTVTEAKASDLRRNTHTVNRFTEIAYNLGLQERIFSERYLRRAPREVTQ